MSLFSRILGPAMALLWATNAAFSIPQNFNQGRGLFLGGGAAFEDFATDAATWMAGAKLPGEWSASPQSDGQTLKEDALVFGFPATRVSAERMNDRITSFRVVLRERAGKSNVVLLERVTRNIRVFTGDSGKERGKDSRLFRRGSVQITAAGISAGEVIVTFTPAS